MDTKSNDEQQRQTEVGESPENRVIISESGGMGITSPESGKDEHDEIGSRGTDSEQRCPGASRVGRRNIGGILRQLKQIKEAHLSYVNAHTERLKERLAEDEAHRQQVIEDIELLEKQIAELIEEENRRNQ